MSDRFAELERRQQGVIACLQALGLSARAVPGGVDISLDSAQRLVELAGLPLNVMRDVGTWAAVARRPPEAEDAPAVAAALRHDPEQVALAIEALRFEAQLAGLAALRRGAPGLPATDWPKAREGESGCPLCGTLLGEEDAPPPVCPLTEEPEDLPAGPPLWRLFCPACDWHGSPQRRTRRTRR